MQGQNRSARLVLAGLEIGLPSPKIGSLRPVLQGQKMVAETYLTKTKNRSERQQHKTVLTAAPRGTAEGTSTLKNVICETTLTELLKGVDIEDTSQLVTVGCSQQEEPNLIHRECGP